MAAVIRVTTIDTTSLSTSRSRNPCALKISFSRANVVCCKSLLTSGRRKAEGCYPRNDKMSYQIRDDVIVGDGEELAGRVQLSALEHAHHQRVHRVSWRVWSGRTGGWRRARGGRRLTRARGWAGPPAGGRSVSTHSGGKWHDAR